MAKITKCKVCGADIATYTKVCQQCGAKAKQPKWWITIIVVLFCVGACVAGALSAPKNSASTKTGDTKAASTSTASTDKKQEENQAVKKEKFEIVGDVTSSNDQFAVYIEGVIKNNSGKKASYIQVTFNLYDKAGNQVGTALANASNVDKDGTWKFKAMGINQNGEVAKYKLANITGF